MVGEKRHEYIETTTVQIINSYVDDRPKWLVSILDGCKSKFLSVMLVNGNHWIVIHSLGRNHVKYYDPLHYDRTEDVRNFLKRLYPDAYIDIRIEAINFELQTDGYNCGIYCCYYIEHVICKKYHEKFNPALYRDYINKVINS